MVTVMVMVMLMLMVMVITLMLVMEWVIVVVILMVCTCVCICVCVYAHMFGRLVVLTFSLPSSTYSTGTPMSRSVSSWLGGSAMETKLRFQIGGAYNSAPMPRMNERGVYVPARHI